MDYFKKFLILSITDSPRQEDMKKNLDSCSISNYEIVEFPTSNKTVNDGRSNLNILDIITHTHCDETCRNITQNHFSLIQRAYSEGLENVVILEDDARFELPLNISRINSAIAWLGRNDWDLFYFGHCPWPIPFSIPRSLNVVKVFTPLTAHAYALSKNGMRKVLRYKDMCKHIDKIYSSLDLEKFAIFPSISFQCIEPALFKRVKLPLSFNSISKGLEITAFILPIFVLMFITCIIIHLFYPRRARL